MLIVEKIDYTGFFEFLENECGVSMACVSSGHRTIDDFVKATHSALKSNMACGGMYCDMICSKDARIIHLLVPCMRQETHDTLCQALEDESKCETFWAFMQCWMKHADIV